VDSFVPNDTFLSAEKNVGIITGSNGSGKSVYLKQVGTIHPSSHTLLCCREIFFSDKYVMGISILTVILLPQMTSLFRFFSFCYRFSNSLSLMLYHPPFHYIGDSFGSMLNMVRWVFWSTWHMWAVSFPASEPSSASPTASSREWLARKQSPPRSPPLLWT
jgi:ABC-type dipeptide/oligopeptide/nickel transport system ATPase component